MTTARTPARSPLAAAMHSVPVVNAGPRWHCALDVSDTQEQLADPLASVEHVTCHEHAKLLAHAVYATPQPLAVADSTSWQ